MALPFTLLILNILNFIVAVVVVIFGSSFRKIASVRWMLLLVISFCIVSFCTLGAYISRDIEVQTLFYRMRFLTLGIIPTCWFLFIVSVYSKWTWPKKPWVVSIILIPGLITALCTLIPSWTDLVIKDFSPVVVYGFSVLQFQTGSWFRYHYLSAMTFVLLSILFGGYFFFQERGFRRRQVVLLILSSSFAAGIDIYCVLTNSPLRWLLISSGTFIFCQLGIVIAAWKLNLLNILPLAMTRVFQEFPDPVFVLDGEKIVRAANKSAISFFGLKKPKGLDFNKVLPHVPFVSGEVCLLNQFNEACFFSLSIEKLVSSGEDLSGYIVFFKEITVQKSIEKRLNENLEFKARLLALVSHDLSGQIESQALLSASLQDDAEGTVLKDKVGLLASSAQASQGFIENIMNWVKGQGTNFELIRKEFEWNMLIRESIEDLEYSWKPKRIRIHFDSTNELLIGMGDSNMLASVIRNILSNAIRATPDNKEIHVSLNATCNNVELKVIDQGMGMGQELLDNLNQQSTEFNFNTGIQSGFQGYGIGIKIVRHFLELHKGKFLIESNAASGTRVSITLPLG